MIGGNYSNEPMRVGSSFASTALLTANTPETIFTPAANVNGAYLWRASQRSGSASSFHAVLLSATVPPSSVTGGGQYLDCDYVTAPGSVYIGGRLNIPVYIPAGYGLYFISSANEANIAYRSALFTLL